MTELLQLTTDQLHIPQEGEPYYDERGRLPVNQSLVDSILLANGVHTPIVVKKRDKKTYWVIAGRQRVKALAAANVARLAANKSPLLMPAREVGDELDDRLATIVITTENTQRTAIAPFIMADRARALYESGWSKEDIKILFAVNDFAVDRWLKLSQAAPETRAAVESGELSVTDATAIATKPDQAAIVQDHQLDGQSGKRQKIKVRSGRELKQLLADFPAMPPMLKNFIEWTLCQTEFDFDPEWAKTDF